MQEQVGTEAERLDAPAMPAERDEKPKATRKRKTETPPEGEEFCYIAIPGRVSLGDLKKGQPGDRLSCKPENIDELEARGLAFRDQMEAKAAFTSWQRKRQKELEARAEAIRKREENRRRIQEQMKADFEVTWKN